MSGHMDEGLHPHSVGLKVCHQLQPSGYGKGCKVNDALQYCMEGAQWLSGKVLDLRLRGRRFEPHQRHCVVSLSMTHLS